MVTKVRAFADACAHPNAKRITVHGRTGPVNAVEFNGTLFIQNNEAEAEAIRLKVMEPASELAVAPAPAVAMAALDPEPCFAAASPAKIKSYAAAVSKPRVRPKLSTAACQPAADIERSTAASKPEAVLTPLEVTM